MENSTEQAPKDLCEPSREAVEIIKHPKLYFITKSLLFLIIIIERLVMLLKGSTSETIIYFLMIALLIPVSIIMEYILFRYMSYKRTTKRMQMIVSLLIHIISFEILIECSLQMLEPERVGEKNILRSNILFMTTLILFFIDSKSYQFLIATYVIAINFFRISTIPSAEYNITWAVMEVILLISAIMLWISDTTESKKQLPEKLQKDFENFTQGLAVITLDGEILYMNGNFKGLMESDYEYEALDKILKLRRFDSYSEKARRKFLEEASKNDKGPSPYFKMKQSFRPKEFSRTFTRNNTNTMRKSGLAEKSIFESDKQSVVTFKESGDNLKVSQRQESNDRSSYINVFNFDENPVTDNPKGKANPQPKPQAHRLLPNKAPAARTETEHGLIPHEDSLQITIESILTKANENSLLKATWDWLEPGKRWLSNFMEINVPVKQSSSDNKAPPKDSMVSKVKLVSKGLSGDLRLLEAQILPFHNMQNQGIFICLSDAMLETRLSDALEINEQKDRILRFVSHEFRTPLNCSLSVLDMLKNKVNTNLCKLYLEPALNSSKLLLSIVNDILDFAQIKAKKLRIFIQACNLKKVIEEVIDMMQLQATAQDIDLSLDWDNEISRQFYTDPNRVKQILLNLISNAFKFTPQGGSVTIKATARHGETVKMEVIDTGRGISQKNLDKLFEEFAKVQESSHLNPQGVGLGLVISRLLSQELGPPGFGLVAESELGRGTVFSFLLVSKLEEAIKYGLTSNTNLDVTDDEERATPENLLHKLQTEYGVIAQATRPAIKEEDIKIRLTDFSSSTKDIRSARSRISVPKTTIISRQEPIVKTNRTTIVRSGTLVFKNALEIEPIKLSALSQGSYVFSKIPNKQFNAHFNKEIGRPKGFGRSKTALAPRESGGETNRLACEFSNLVHNLNQRCNRAKVLVVDDDAFNLTAVTLLLKNMDLSSISVVDGEQAIHEVLKHQDHHEECKNYSIILMDVEMPRMNGFETTKILRRKMLEGEISFIPIIGITGHNPKEKKAECLISGMNDMVIKPITPQILQDIMLKWVDDVDV